ncbi:TcmI family type II polyketide cyclase [Ktedonosporobacter rubrisoli]|uniref:TcmI family type II polyketide cyclase n=1 Tax=Ktedonosporobacter rubrisoli TaxID=2509675 RepID=A0A4P6JP45_KTERU|nr:TcmI family type II polyketide cyclase [Ktedonosporobacter rubrisoli]QBD76900.1 TcmI family type II polyketide cyclase [Ktedonosporobacter rubrisoli]
MGYIRNTVLITAPVDEVMRLTNNVRIWPSLFTEYESSEVLEEEADCVTFQLTTRPNEQGEQYSWIARRKTDRARRATISERMPSSGPFEHMIIRWWYDPVEKDCTAMTWEQEFAIKADVSLTEEAATNYLNKQTRIQQQAIKAKVESLCMQQTKGSETKLYHGIVISRLLHPDNAEKIATAFRRSDATELPHLAGVKSRRIWIQGDLCLHLIEAKSPIPTILRDYAGHPLLKTIQSEVDSYVELVYPGTQANALEIYRWDNTQPD